jgi:tetratricopeptide (TPR) repeat protein
MSAEPQSPLDDVTAPPQRQASFGKFLRDVLIVVLIGAGIMYWYLGFTRTQKEIGDLTLAARSKMNRHDLPSLQEAESLYRKILELDSGHGQSWASLARTLYYQSSHGLDTLADARTSLQKARSAGAETPSRYAVEGYLKVAEGDAKAAVAQVKDWIEEGKAAPPVAHALAVAHLSDGDYISSSRVARQAREADFSNVAIRLTLAEASHRAGEEKDAIKALDAIVRSNMNPDHMLAKAWLGALRAKNYGSLTKPVNILNDLKKVAEDEQRLGPRAKAMITWTEGELSLALGNADGALEKAKEALKIAPDYPPFHDLDARAHLAKGATEDALAAYEKAVAATPVYRGIKWDFAKLKSRMGDDSALALVDELEKTDSAKYKGPRYLVFKAEHSLRKGNIEEAKELFTQAAEEGDDAAILFGLAKVAFEEEKKKDKKADLERVGEAFQLTLEKKRRYPEVHEYLAGISLWNFLTEGAHGEFEQAEKQYKALKRPVPEVIAFYNRAISMFENVKESRLRREASKYSQEWKQKKSDYLQSLQSS